MTSSNTNCVHDAHRENWKHIQDAKERKKVQNRIAQRTYRQRIREKMANLERMARTCHGGNENAQTKRRSRQESRDSHGSDSRSSTDFSTPIRRRKVTPSISDSAHSKTASEIEPVLSQSDFSPDSATTEEFMLRHFNDTLPTTEGTYMQSGTLWKDLPPDFLSWDMGSYIDVPHDSNGVADTTPAGNGVAADKRQPCQPTATIANSHSVCTNEYRRGVFTTASHNVHSLKESCNGTSAPKTGRTALHLAAEGGNAEIVQMLLRQNANPLAQDCVGRTALHIAVDKGNEDVALVLVREAPSLIDVRGKGGRTSLHLAASRGNADMLSQLIAAGGELEAKDEDGKTPLHLAVSQGHAEVLHILLEEGADVNSRMGP